MRAIFIADAHLRQPEDANYLLIQRFLRDLIGKTDLLVIAGDFFEFWLGDSPEAFPHYRLILDTLEEVTRSGVRLVFIEGNHDFHLGGYFRAAFNAEVFAESTSLVLDGRRIYVCHGDLINRNDYGYLLLRMFFRNPLVRLLAKVLPATVPAWVARKLGTRSKNNHQAVAVKWDAGQLVREFAAKRFALGDDIVITAHYHRPFIEKYNEKQLLALGDWITQFSYGELLDGELSVRRYTADS